MFVYIVVTFFGLMLGNFGTSLFYRLPRGISISAYNSSYRPFCSFCHHRLKFYEYMPLISWFYTMGKCSYCKESIDKNYWLLEFVTALLSLLAYLNYGLTDQYFLVTLMGAILFTQTAIYITHKTFYPSMHVAIFILGLLYVAIQGYGIKQILYLLSMGIIFHISIIKILQKYCSHYTNISYLIQSHFIQLHFFILLCNLILWMSCFDFLILLLMLFVFCIIALQFFKARSRNSND